MTGGRGADLGEAASTGELPGAHRDRGTVRGPGHRGSGVTQVGDSAESALLVLLRREPRGTQRGESTCGVLLHRAHRAAERLGDVGFGEVGRNRSTSTSR